MRSFIQATVLLPALLLVGCSFGGKDADASRVDRCTTRILERGAFPPAGEGATQDGRRQFVRRSYCQRFDASGWVYEDGSLTIDAYRDAGRVRCMTLTVNADGTPRMVSCDSLGPSERVRRVDCALLDVVRGDDIDAYLAGLRRPIECDDGTPLDELGVR